MRIRWWLVIAGAFGLLGLLAACKTGPAASPGTKRDRPPARSTSPPSAGLVDINTASKADLEALPGIGPAYADRIIAGRPYANKTQLRSRRIIPESVYARIDSRIIARQPE
jgi:competence protein ComEA